MSKLYYQNQTYTFKSFLEKENDNEFVIQTQAIIKNWFQGNQTFSLFTSGSTGKPKEISFSRKQLEISASQTFDTFKLAKGDCLLACLSPEHAAGFMMIIRALIYDCELYLVEPCANPLKEIPPSMKIDFAAFVPYQMTSIMSSINAHEALLNRMKAIILGGGPISGTLKNQVEQLACPVFHTYGMTETLTHVAIRNLKSSDSSFYGLKGVEFSTNKNNCLIIKSPLNPDQEIITTDVVRLINKNNFEWIGRFDHVINSGGIKIHINLLEKKIENTLWIYFPGVRFFITSIKDDSLGEMLILLIEAHADDQKLIQMMDTFKQTIKSFEIPKKVFFIQNFENASLGKIDRIKSLKLLGKNV